MNKNLTRRQQTRALAIWQELRLIAPDTVTAYEATSLCMGYNILNDKFRRVAKADQHSRPINLMQIAVEITKKEAK